MTFKICYWDEVTKTQKERNSTPSEDAQRLKDLEYVAVPARVTRRQALQALFLEGHLENIEPLIDDLPSPQKELARIEWQAAMDFERSWPLVNQLGALLNLSDSDIDQLFIKASQL